jgi:hypothetical protein
MWSTSTFNLSKTMKTYKKINRLRHMALSKALGTTTVQFAIFDDLLIERFLRYPICELAIFFVRRTNIAASLNLKIEYQQDDTYDQ